MVQVQMGALILCRIMSFLVIGPVFSQRGFPNMAKMVVGFSLVMSAFPAVHGYKELSMILFSLAAVKEILFGLAMGYLSQLVFNAVMMAGQMIDFQVGFSMAQAYDTTMQMLTSQFGKLYYWLALCVFFMLNLHQQMIYGILESFRLVPLGAIVLRGFTVDGVVKLFAGMAAMSLSLAAPLVVSVLVIDLVLGIISRSIPQINVLMLSLSVKTAVSLIIFLLLLPNLTSFLGTHLAESIADMMEFVRSIQRAR
ncbi:flagellar biosynthetic protein FliR [Liquorilactobacillus capillatus]|uniref:Flagellar biosynthetic protein fliR n=2 Tax=Liquorilactobacillus capillatus TaxID=480931 RepID=A0A0R1MA83_9LACO|nr:flagellar biosynthetic protein FliR [Liquorilactobacillus capillatus]AJA33889.1 flagellar biosynthetic protein FliR [Liquorilactobacillus capillatus]KRL02101.1 flagellar biosynthetic protein fliR [Liquorilactobacillus capillatus DSM 19910]